MAAAVVVVVLGKLSCKVKLGMDLNRFSFKIVVTFKRELCICLRVLKVKCNGQRKRLNSTRSSDLPQLLLLLLLAE